MAKKNSKEEKLNYSAELRRLKDFGPERLYLLWGPEDYLREQYLGQLKKICLPEGEDSFSYKRINGPELDMHELRMAVDAMPFMTERSFVELRSVDINACKDSDKMLAILKDIPDYCTVAIVQDAQYEPDGRLKLIKGIRQCALELKFTAQSQGMLIDWLIRRFSAAGKSTSRSAVISTPKYFESWLARSIAALTTASEVLTGRMMRKFIFPSANMVSAFSAGTGSLVASPDDVPSEPS